MGNLLDLARTHPEPVAVPVNDPAEAHYRWLVILPDGTAFEVCCSPELTLGEMRELYRGATLQALPDLARDYSGIGDNERLE